MSEDLPSGKEFFEAARKKLGYEKNLLCNEGRTYDGCETDGEYCMEVKFNAGIDNLGQEIALECGQAKEIAPGVVKYRSREPERFLTSEEREIERQEFGPNLARGFIGKDILAVPEREYRKQLASEFRAAIDALPPTPEEPDRVPLLLDDWLRAAWRGSSITAHPQRQAEIPSQRQAEAERLTYDAIHSCGPYYSDIE